MKKFISGVIFFILLFSSKPFAEEETAFPIFFLENPAIKIDGKKDEWPEIYPAIVESDSQIHYGERKNPGDFSFKIWCLFDNKNIYLFADYMDSDPLINKNIGNDIYQGDSLEVYLGFHEEKNESAFGPHDFQFGIGASKNAPETFLWFKRRELKGTDIKTAKSEKGFVIEAKIPINNFGKYSVKDGDTIWIDFAANNGIKGGKRTVQIIWNGNGKGWQTPSVWRKAKLFADINKFKEPKILLPLEVVKGKAHRLYVWNEGKPWQGEIKIDDKSYKTNKAGFFKYLPDNKGPAEIILNVDGKELKKPIDVLKKEEKIFITMPVKYIKVNQLGYNSDDRKSFVATNVEKRLKLKEFEIITLMKNEVVFKGELVGPKTDRVTKDEVYSGDFSDLKEPGRYMVRVKGLNKSYVFSIEDDVYAKLFYTTMRSYFLQRCGFELNDEITGLMHKECHNEDAVLIEDFRRSNGEQKVKIDTTGGWHDAGDYGKYIPSAGLSVTPLLMLYEIKKDEIKGFSLDLPESNNFTPDFLDEIKYELDWMLKMQTKSGGVYHKVNSQSFPPSIMPDKDKAKRFIYEIGTADTAIFAGTMAYAARVWEDEDSDYSEKLKNAALLSGNFLLDNLHKKVYWPTNDDTGAYKTGSVGDELFWAFAELYRLTAEKKYLDAALKLKGINLTYPAIGWDNTYTLGLYALLKAKGAPVDFVKSVKELIKTESDKLVRKIENNGYHSALGVNEYYWGSNKVACVKGMQLIMAYNLFKDESYKIAARYQLDYVLGVNCLSKSFVMKIGIDTVNYPHHRIVEFIEKDIPGIMVGGPNNNAEDGVYKKDLGPRGYIDSHQSFASNENAIDYNAPLVFLAGYFMKGSDVSVYTSISTIIVGILMGILIVAGIISLIIFLIKNKKITQVKKNKKAKKAAKKTRK